MLIWGTSITMEDFHMYMELTVQYFWWCP